MQKAFTKPEQIKLLEHPHIIYASTKTIKFSSFLLKQITNNCFSMTDIRILLDKFNIPQIVITTKRIKNLYTRYVSGGCSDRIRMPRKYFSNNEVQYLSSLEVVAKCSKSNITYTSEFKVKIADCINLTDARKLMLDNNIPLDIIGERRFENTYYRLRNQKQKKGNGSFSNEQRGRKPNVQSEQYKNLTDTQKVAFLEKRLKERDGEIDFLKKYMPSLLKCKTKIKHWYKAIKLACEDGKYVPYQLCKTIGINPSGYYKYVKRNRVISKKMKFDKMILADIKYLQIKHKRKLGYRQITMQINKFYSTINFPKVNAKRILRLMRENELLGIIRAKNPSKHIWRATKEDKISPNHLSRKFTSGKPLEKILTDISYLRCKFGFVYLSAAKDSVTNEIIAFNVKRNMNLELSLEIIDDIAKLPLANNAMIHSDQGVHYTAKEYRKKVKGLNITQSMSRRGNCWDNAPMESFFGHMKDEMNFMEFNTFKEVYEAVENYMIYYNQERPQWKLKKMTPLEYRCHLQSI